MTSSRVLLSCEPESFLVMKGRNEVDFLVGLKGIYFSKKSMKKTLNFFFLARATHIFNLKAVIERTAREEWETWEREKTNKQIKFAKIRDIIFHFPSSFASCVTTQLIPFLLSSSNFYRPTHCLHYLHFSLSHSALTPGWRREWRWFWLKNYFFFLHFISRGLTCEMRRESEDDRGE